jgi:hypothetical protein
VYLKELKILMSSYLFLVALFRNDLAGLRLGTLASSNSRMDERRTVEEEALVEM